MSRRAAQRAVLKACMRWRMADLTADDGAGITPDLAEDLRDALEEAIDNWLATFREAHCLRSISDLKHARRDGLIRWGK